MSPLLVSLFIEDLELFLQKDTTSGLSIDDTVLILLLLLTIWLLLLNIPKNYKVTSIFFTIILQKTKITVFRKRGRLLPTEHWTYNGSDIVGDFNYLGAVFHYSGNFNVNQEYLVGKALKQI